MAFVSGRDTFCNEVVMTFTQAGSDKLLVAWTTNGAVPPCQAKFTLVPARLSDASTVFNHDSQAKTATLLVESFYPIYSA